MQRWWDLRARYPFIALALAGGLLEWPPQILASPQRPARLAGNVEFQCTQTALLDAASLASAAIS